MAAMAMLALAAGLPYGAVQGTLNAWLTAEGVKPSTIGVLSFIILAYSYKFIWAPAFQKPAFPFPQKLGPRRAWLLAFQLLIAALLGVLAMLKPAESIGAVALIGICVALASATHDIVLDAWRIEIARSEEDVDVMSALYQFGYRMSGLLTGAVALVVAQRIGWGPTYAGIAICMALLAIGSLIAPEPGKDASGDDAAAAAEKPPASAPTFAAELAPRERMLAVAATAAGWAASIFLIVQFVWTALASGEPVSGGKFVLETGPMIVGLSVVLPAIMAAWLLGRRRADHKLEVTGPVQSAGLSLFRVVMDPLMDLLERLGWGAVLVLVLVLSYRFTDLVWGAFAYPFYLGQDNGALGMTNDDVALASKTIGVVMTIAGAGVGAAALVALGRMPCLVIGAFLAAITNLLFADLAAGGAHIDAFLQLTGLGPMMAATGISERLARLIAAIAGENLAVGFASVASTAFLTSIVNPRFAAVQYALLASLTMLIGSLGRVPIGNMIEEQGFFPVFVLTTWLGLIAVALSAAEWARQAWTGRRPPRARGQGAA